MPRNSGCSHSMNLEKELIINGEIVNDMSMVNNCCSLYSGSMYISLSSSLSSSLKGHMFRFCWVCHPVII